MGLIKIFIIAIVISSCCKKDKCKVDIQTGTELMLVPNADGTISQYYYDTYKTIDTCKPSS